MSQAECPGPSPVAPPSLSAKQTSVIEIIRSLDLPSPQKERLIFLVETRDSAIINAIEISSPQELQQQLIRFAGMEPMDTTSEGSVSAKLEAANSAFEAALSQMNSSKAKVVQSAIRAILKMLQSVKKNPEDKRHRKLKLNNLVVKKYVVDIAGGLDFMRAVGFERIGDDGKDASLEMPQAQVDIELLTAAEDILTRKLTELEEEVKAPASDRPRVRCKGNCGFFGDEKTDDYCSVCYNKKFFGIKDPEPAEKKVASSGPPKCSKNCGNYGSAKYKGMCSTCFKLHGVTPDKRDWRPRFHAAKLKLRAIHRFMQGRKLGQKNKSRCYLCRRKLGILGIQCRCGFVFCGEHRYPSNHNCDFDYRKLHKKKLLKENPTIQDDKMDDKL